MAYAIFLHTEVYQTNKFYVVMPKSIAFIIYDLDAKKAIHTAHLLPSNFFRKFLEALKEHNINPTKWNSAIVLDEQKMQRAIFWRLKAEFEKSLTEKDLEKFQEQFDSLPYHFLDLVSMGFAKTGRIRRFRELCREYKIHLLNKATPTEYVQTMQKLFETLSYFG